MSKAKKLIFGTLIGISLSGAASAGDLHLSCYRGGDQGAYFKDPVVFMESNTCSMVIRDKKTTYVVLVSREGLFENYRYEIIEIGSSGSYRKRTVTPINYDDPVSITGNIDCQVAD